MFYQSQLYWPSTWSHATSLTQFFVDAQQSSNSAHRFIGCADTELVVALCAEALLSLSVKKQCWNGYNHKSTPTKWVMALDGVISAAHLWSSSLSVLVTLLRVHTAESLVKHVWANTLYHLYSLLLRLSGADGGRMAAGTLHNSGCLLWTNDKADFLCVDRSATPVAPAVYNVGL